MAKTTDEREYLITELWRLRLMQWCKAEQLATRGHVVSTAMIPPVWASEWGVFVHMEGEHVLPEPSTTRRLKWPEVERLVKGESVQEILASRCGRKLVPAKKRKPSTSVREAAHRKYAVA